MRMGDTKKRDGSHHSRNLDMPHHCRFCKHSKVGGVPRVSSPPLYQTTTPHSILSMWAHMAAKAFLVSSTWCPLPPVVMMAAISLKR